MLLSFQQAVLKVSPFGQLYFQLFIYSFMFSEEEIQNDIIQHYQPWKLKDPKVVKLQRMTGITNATFKAQIQGESQAIIYRRFGESEENLFLSRSQETHIYEQMSTSGDGPKIFYYDQKFRLQEFIDSTVLQSKYMLQPGYLQQVAYTLAHFHKSKPQSPFISKENLFRKSFLNSKQKLLKICQTKLAKDIYEQSQKQIVELLKSWVTQQQLYYLQRLMVKYEQQWEMVFSHNDLLVNNVLIRKDNKKFIFIDFEYATYNFPFYDIANYFEESFINYQVTKSPYFDFINPSEEVKNLKQRFIDAYVVAKDFSLEDFRLSFDKVKKNEKYVKESERLSKEVGVGRLLCSLMWGWWSIIVSKNPNINFDYIKFAQWRYYNYQQQKKNLNI